MLSSLFLLSGEVRLGSVLVVAEKVFKRRLKAGVGAQRCYCMEKVLGKALEKIIGKSVDSSCRNWKKQRGLDIRKA